MRLPLTFLFLIFIVSACYRNNNSKEASPNILLIIADDVTHDHWSCYGDTLPTPHIEDLARNGMMFHQAYTSSAACTPSRYTIMTGQYAGRSMSPEFRKANPVDQPYVIAWNTPIIDENLCLHEVMKEAGYYTGFVGKFHIGSPSYDDPERNPRMPYIDPDISPESKEADSLLAIYQMLVSARVRELTGADFAGAIQWENPEQLPIKGIRQHNLEYQVWAVRNFFKELKGDKPFFLTVNSTALHGPNHFEDLAKDPSLSAEGRIEALKHIMPARSTIFQRLYDLGYVYGESAEDHVNHYLAGRIYMDDQLGAIMAMLREFDLEENTLVIYTADHNIEPGKATIYNRGVNVPFVAWWPGHIEAGKQSYDHIQFVDFLPTFAELGGIELSNKMQFDGQSFTRVFKGPLMFDDRTLYFEEGYTRGISNGKYKYIAMRFPAAVLDSLRSVSTDIISHLGTQRAAHASIAMEYYPSFFDADQLFDLEADPYEQNNLAKDPAYASVLNKMKSDLQEVLLTFDHPYDLSATSFESETWYKDAASSAMEIGTDWIKWWDRQLDYPPSGK